MPDTAAKIQAVFKDGIVRPFEGTLSLVSNPTPTKLNIPAKPAISSFVSCYFQPKKSSTRVVVLVNTPSSVLPSSAETSSSVESDRC